MQRVRKKCSSNATFDYSDWTNRKLITNPSYELPSVYLSKRLRYNSLTPQCVVLLTFVCIMGLSTGHCTLHCELQFQPRMAF